MAFLHRDQNEGTYRKYCTYCDNHGVVLDKEGNLFVCHRCNGSSEGFSSSLMKYFEGFRGFNVMKGI